MEWIVANIGTIIVSILVVGIVVAIVLNQIVRKKQGKSSCSCGCSRCANSQYCHSAKQKESENKAR